VRAVTRTARRHQMFLPGDVVLVCVSGGPDSVCLLHALTRLRRLFRIDVACFHFDHALRTDSGRDLRYAERQARALGVPFLARRAEGRPRRGASVEAWARTARYQAISEVRQELGARVATVGHTADDQAETVLLALLRGGGLEAMAAMAPVSPPIVRPLLEITRAETAAFCRALGLRPRRDPMNEDQSFLRPLVRHRVLPALERAMDGRGVRNPILRTAELLRGDAELLRSLALEAEASVVERPDGALLLHAERLSGLAEPLASRVVRSALLEVGLPPTAAHVSAVLDLARGRAGRRRSLGGGLLARRDRGYVRLSRPSPVSGGGAPASRPLVRGRDP
jgi:tRNA(Ile)-lysidine synthase